MDLSVAEIAGKLTKKAKDGSVITVSRATAGKRLNRHGYKPLKYIGVAAVYRLTNDDIEYLKNCDVRGPGPKKNKTKIKAKTKKTTKKN